MIGRLRSHDEGAPVLLIGRRRDVFRIEFRVRGVVGGVMIEFRLLLVGFLMAVLRIHIRRLLLLLLLLLCFEAERRDVEIFGLLKGQDLFIYLYIVILYKFFYCNGCLNLKKERIEIWGYLEASLFTRLCVWILESSTF